MIHDEAYRLAQYCLEKALPWSTWFEVSRDVNDLSYFPANIACVTFTSPLNEHSDNPTLYRKSGVHRGRHYFPYCGSKT